MANRGRTTFFFTKKLKDFRVEFDALLDQSDGRSHGPKQRNPDIREFPRRIARMLHHRPILLCTPPSLLDMCWADPNA
ncbi:hypothetical protein BCO18430_03323 [Burkholderia contaminans]|uniref:hypothetical protein n=1 Tax=Burkholderia contaminans TaxID=488447 RepID=UPI001453A289|nr:hypothetical protein [Burkholderia contaminans]VWC92166.1 hypothetical protein BCO18430_03323 [Burkholderia contaminans]